MAYTRQSPSAVGLTWAGRAAYTRQAPAAVALTFATSFQASGWLATNFGLPSVTAHPVTGFMPVHFGTVGLAQHPVTGFKAANFGVPKANFGVRPTGFKPVNFGANLTLLPHAVALRAARFGAITLLPHAVALRAVHFGTALAMQRNHVTAWRSAVFGTPTAPSMRTAQVRGFTCARLGYSVALQYVPRARHLHGHVSSLRPVRFGIPHL